MVICLAQGANLHMAQLMPLPLAVSCFSKIQIDFAFLVPAHPGSPGQRAVKWVCVCAWMPPPPPLQQLFFHAESATASSSWSSTFIGSRSNSLGDK